MEELSFIGNLHTPLHKLWPQLWYFRKFTDI